MTSVFLKLFVFSKLGSLQDDEEVTCVFVSD